MVKDFQYKTANKLIENKDGEPLLLVGEDLDISKMIASAKGTKDNPGINVALKSDLSRRWVATAPYRFRMILQNKVRFNPMITLLFINPAWTSRRCNKCKSTNHYRIAEYFECLDCKHVTNANSNAGKNIKDQGVLVYQTLGAGTLLNSKSLTYNNH
jgi:putative transposase